MLRMLRILFRPKCKELTGDKHRCVMRIILNIIGMILGMRVGRGMQHTWRMKNSQAQRILFERLNEPYNLENIHVEGKKTLKFVVNKQTLVCRLRFYLTQGRDKRRASVKSVVMLRVTKHCAELDYTMDCRFPKKKFRPLSQLRVNFHRGFMSVSNSLCTTIISFHQTLHHP